MSETMTNDRLIDLSIVSAEATIYEGKALALFVTGEVGELGLAHGHSPLLTFIKPGFIRVLQSPGTEEIFYISGGMLEVQPSVMSVLADSIVRASDLDEAAAIDAKNRAEKALADKKADVDYSQLLVQLAEATAQLRAIKELRNLNK